MFPTSVLSTPNFTSQTPIPPTVNNSLDLSAYPSSSTTTATLPTHEGNSPNLLERLLPTGGAIAGGILGTITGGPLAGIAGATAGGAAARALENKLTHQNWKNELGGTAVQSALGQAGGEVLGWAGKGILGKLVSPTADKLAGQFVQGQFAPGTMTGSLAKQLFEDYGITDAGQIPQIAAQLTGKAGGTGAVFNNAVEDSLKNLARAGHTINVDGLISEPGGSGIVNDLVSGQTALGKNAGTKLIDSVNKAVQNMLGGSEGMVGIQEADPLDVLQQSRIFDGLASQARNKAFDAAGAVANPEQAAVADVYSQMADELKTRLFTPNGQQLLLTPDIKTSLINNLSPVRDINPQAYAKLADEVNLSNTVEELRNLQSKWVQANQAFAKTAAKADLAGGMSVANAGNSALPIAAAVAGKGKGLAAGTLGALTKSQAVDRTLASALSGLSDFTGSQGLKTGIDVGGTALGQLVGNLPNEAAPPTNPDLLNGALTSDNNQGTNMNQPPNIFEALTHPGGGVSAQYAPIALQALLGMFAPSMLTQGTIGTNANAAEQNIQKAQTAASLLPNLRTMFEEAGGGQGGIGGILSRLSGIIPGSAAANYGTQADQVAKTLSEATGTEISPGELPQLTQSTQTARDTLARLESLLTALGANPGGQTAIGQLAQ